MNCLSKYSQLTEDKKEIIRKAANKYYQENKLKCAEKAKEWRIKNKEYIKDKQRLDKRNRKEEAIVYLGGRCHSCSGTFHPAIFEFHHKDPSTKEGKDPSKCLSFSWKKLQQELDKCILVCANCHRLIHHEGSYEKE